MSVSADEKLWTRVLLQSDSNVHTNPVKHDLLHPDDCPLKTTAKTMTIPLPLLCSPRFDYFARCCLALSSRAALSLKIGRLNLAHNDKLLSYKT